MNTFGPRQTVAAAALLAFSCAAVHAQTTVNAVRASVNLNNNNGRGAQGVALDPVTGYFYIALNGALIGNCGTPGSQLTPAPPGTANRLSIVNAETASEVAVVATGTGPVWPTVDPIRRVVFVANSGDGTVTIHDAATGRLAGSIATGGKPHQGGLDLTSRLMWIGNTVRSSDVLAEQNHASFIDTGANRIVREFETGQAPHGVVVDQERHLAYATSVGDGVITVFNMESGTELFSRAPKNEISSVAGNNNLIARQASTRRLLQANGQPGASGALVVDEVTLRLEARIDFRGAPPWGMAVDEANRLLLAAMPGSNTVAVADLDTLTHVATIPVGGCPFAVAIDETRRVAVSSNGGSPTTNATASIIDMCAVYAATGRSTASCR